MLQRIFRIITSNARDNSVLLLASFVIGGGTGLFFLTGNNEPTADLTPDVVVSESPTPTPSNSQIPIMSPSPSPTKTAIKKTTSPTPTTTTTAPSGGGGGGGGTVTYTLTTASFDPTTGTVSQSPAGTNTWTISASPLAGYEFVGWDCAPGASATTTITITANTLCIATFIPVVLPSPTDTVLPSPTDTVLPSPT